MDPHKPGLSDAIRQLPRHPSDLEWLELSLDEAEPARRAELEEHLELCPICREKYQNMQTLPQIPETVPAVLSDQNMEAQWLKLQDQLDRQADAPLPTPAQIKPPRIYPSWALAAALIAACGLMLLISQGRQTPSGMSATTVTALVPSDQVTRSGGAPVSDVSCPPADAKNPQVVLLIPVAADSADVRYNVVLQRQDGSEEKIEQVQAHGFGQLAISVPFNKLPDGRHQLRVSAVTPPSQSTVPTPSKLNLNVRCRTDPRP